MSTALPTPEDNTPSRDPGNVSDTDFDRDRDRDRRSVVDREKAEFGGMKFGSAFFGWLTATGLTVLLLALVTAVGAGIAGNTDGGAADDAAQNPTTTGIVGIIVLLAILLLAYYCGGYVAGRMARFSGAKQGIAVWLWAIIITVILAIVGVIAGSQLEVLSQIGTIPTGTFDTGQITLTGVLSLVAVIVVTLGGAILGGLAGMRFHRKVDRVGLGR